jgi:ATP-binding cassette subfamily C protein CydCD
MLPVCMPAVHDGALPAGVVAVLVLLPLALIDPMLGVVSAVQLWPTLAAALGLTQDVTERALRVEENDGIGVLASTVDELSLENVAGRWPMAPRPVFEGVTAAVNRGDWLVLRGPSGSGKSTLLTLLLGYLQPAAGRYTLAGLNTVDVARADLRRHISWAPQEGHLFDSTIRANLLLARRREEAPHDEEMIDVLHQVGLGGLLESLPLGLETRVGSQGSHLSGGQRQRLAVARTLLTGADVVLLDEPTAHLDEESAAALMADLRAATGDQIAVLVTHSNADIREGDYVVDLARTGIPVPSTNPVG